jgi:aryl sulfotransferase
MTSNPNQQAGAVAWPEKTRELQNFVMDSTKWNGFDFRDDDIVIATWSKSGTTWTQQIVSQLIFQGDETVFGQAISPWIDFQLTPEARAFAEAQTHRRFLKTHLPLDALVFSPKAKYLYVGRDARDVAFSFHHHLRSFTPAAAQRFAEIAQRIGATLPPQAPEDVRAFYKIWLETDTVSSNSFWKNAQGWWDARKLPNVMLLHYANLKADLPGEMRRIAKFLDIAIDEDKLPKMVENCSIEHMRKVSKQSPLLEEVFVGGGDTFLNKGTNGRWRDVLTEEEIARCDEVAALNLTPDCAHWLKTGEMPTD